METVRFGKISSVNYEAGTVRVVYHEKDDCVTSEIPLLSSEYMMPEVTMPFSFCTSQTAQM